MRLDPRSSPHHLGAALLSAITIGAVIAPVAAIADDGQLEDTAEQAILATPAVCDDLLTVATSDGITGDQLAVAITAQAFDADTPGWSNVGWEAAAGTVFVTGTDDTVTEAVDATSATDVASLSFCGTAVPPNDGAPLEAAPPASPGRSTSAESETTRTTRATHRTPAATAEAPAAAPEATPAPEPPPTEPTTHDSGPGPAVATAPMPEPPAEKPTAGDAADGHDVKYAYNANNEEVEVMGIQLTREEQPGGNGPSIMTVALLITTALLATAGGLLESRNS